MRGDSRENLENKDSKKFWELVRILSDLRKAAAGKTRIAFCVENVMMDPEPKEQISSELGCRPVKISAGPVCASNRDRLFWLNFPIVPTKGETLRKDKVQNELTLVKDPR